MLYLTRHRRAILRAHNLEGVDAGHGGNCLIDFLCALLVVFQEGYEFAVVLQLLLLHRHEVVNVLSEGAQMLY